MPTILHITNHEGTIKNLENVCRHLQYPLQTLKNNLPYYISKTHADECWYDFSHIVKDFQILFFTDTTMYARPFLQNMDKHDAFIIIYITNRYDWGFFGNHSEDRVLYDELYSRWSNHPRVFFTADNRYDQWLAASYGIHFRDKDIIRLIPELRTGVSPTNVRKMFLYNRGTPIHCYREHLDKHQITYDIYGPGHTRYRDTAHIAEYLGIIHLPYQTNIQSLWENLGHGNVYFIPSKTFLTNLITTTDWYYWEEKTKPTVLQSIELAEWYQEDLRECFVYFDDWEDLARQIDNINILQKKATIFSIVEKSNVTNLDKWKKWVNNLISV